MNALRGACSSLNRARMEKFQLYSQKKVQDSVQKMMESLLRQDPLPEDPVSYMIEHLQRVRNDDERESSRASSSDSLGPAAAQAGAREALVTRLNSAVAGMSEEALLSLVESAEQSGGGVAKLELHRPVSTPENLIACTFTEAGSLGLKLNEHEDGAVVVKLNKGTQATTHAQLRPGLRLMRVGDVDVARIGYKAILGRLREAGRPVTIHFAADASAAAFVQQALEDAQALAAMAASPEAAKMEAEAPKRRGPKKMKKPKRSYGPPQGGGAPTTVP